jgi:hypothetical protein
MTDHPLDVVDHHHHMDEDGRWRPESMDGLDGYRKQLRAKRQKAREPLPMSAPDDGGLAEFDAGWAYVEALGEEK